MTYFPAGQYHRRYGLNCCVRDGNRCCPAPMITENRVPAFRREHALCSGASSWFSDSEAIEVMALSGSMFICELRYVDDTSLGALL